MPVVVHSAMHCLGFFFILYTPLVKPTKHARLVNWSNLISLLNSSFLSNNDKAWRVKTRKFHSSSEFAENLIWSIKLSIFFSFLENQYIGMFFIKMFGFCQNSTKRYETCYTATHYWKFHGTRCVPWQPLRGISRYETLHTASQYRTFHDTRSVTRQSVPDIPRYETRLTAIYQGEFHDRRHTTPPIRGNFTLRDASHGNPVLDT